MGIGKKLRSSISQHYSMPSLLAGVVLGMVLFMTYDVLRHRPGSPFLSRYTPQSRTTPGTDAMRMMAQTPPHLAPVPPPPAPLPPPPVPSTADPMAHQSKAMVRAAGSLKSLPINEDWLRIYRHYLSRIESRYLLAKDESVREKIRNEASEVIKDAHQRGEQMIQTSPEISLREQRLRQTLNLDR